MDFFRVKVHLWSVLLIVVVVAGLLIAAFVYGGMNVLSLSSVFGTKSESHDSQLITSMQKEEQVVLLSLGVQGIKSAKDSGDVWGVDIPGTGRAKYIEYTFNAKLGFDGKDVKITPDGDDAYRVSIPAFMFIGQDKPHYEVVAENNEVLSLVTRDISETKMINTILNDDAKKTYIARNRQALRDQAEVFYTHIAAAVDPTVKLTFEFTD